MTTDNERKSRLSHVPGILAGSAALIAALTTVYVNVGRDDKAPKPTPEATVIAVKPADAAQPVPVPEPVGPVRRLLKLERIRVENDGSLGTTDWTFEVSAAGEPLYSLTFKSLNDREGQNLVLPPADAHSSASFDAAPKAAVDISVKGWKRNLLPGGTTADIEGLGRVEPGTTSFPVRAVSDQDGGPEITLYFSIAPENRE